MKKTAEETIIEKVGDFWWTCEDHKLDFLAAMEEYASQSLPPVSEEEIKEPDIIVFGVHLTGHDYATVEQIYSDWRISSKARALSRLPQREV